MVDRAKGIVKVSGWQVSATEAKNALLRHPDVLDVAVVGVGKDVVEHLLACVVVRDLSLTANYNLLHLRERLTVYRVSRCKVQFLNTLPRNESLKILQNLRLAKHQA